MGKIFTLIKTFSIRKNQIALLLGKVAKINLLLNKRVAFKQWIKGVNKQKSIYKGAQNVIRCLTRTHKERLSSTFLMLRSM